MGLIDESGADIKNLLTPGRISIVLLRNLPENMRALTAGVLAHILAERMSKYHQSRKAARRRGSKTPEGDMPERLWLGVGEAHVIVPGEGETPAGEAVVADSANGRTFVQRTRPRLAAHGGNAPESGGRTEC